MRYVSCGQVLEVVKNSTGSIRLRLDEDRGWMSYKDHLVVRLDDEGNPIEKMKPKPKPNFDASRRRASVSSCGVGDVSAQFAQLSGGGLGGGEQVFKVRQSHISKASKNIQLKVGGMGVTLFDGPKMLKSYLYFDLKGW